MTDLTTSTHSGTIAAAIDQLNDGDVDGYLTTLYHPSCTFHGFPPEFGTSRDGIAEFFRAVIAGAPDVRITARDVVAEGNRVAVRYTVSGTHEGELFGAASTGRRLTVEGMTILRFDGDRVSERWNRLDDVALLMQLGALPTPA